MRLACPRGLATLCLYHCSTCVAQGIKAMMTWRRPHLPHTLRRQYLQSPQLNDGNWKRGLRSLRDLTQHLTTRADDSHAAPCIRSLLTINFHLYSKHILALVRFLAYHRIKPHAPPLVRTPVNSFEFHPCGRTPQVVYLALSLRHSELNSEQQVNIV
jgi:hypothetical protein